MTAKCMWIRDWRRCWPALMASMSPTFRGSPWPYGSGPTAIPSSLTTTTRRRWTPMTGQRRSTDIGRPCRRCHWCCAAAETSRQKASCRSLPAQCSGESSPRLSNGATANCERNWRRASAPLGRSAWGSVGSGTSQWSPVPTPACFYTSRASPSFRLPSTCCRSPAAVARCCRSALGGERWTLALGRVSTCDQPRGSPWPSAAREGTSTRRQWHAIPGQGERHGQCRPRIGPWCCPNNALARSVECRRTFHESTSSAWASPGASAPCWQARLPQLRHNTTATWLCYGGFWSTHHVAARWAP